MNLNLWMCTGCGKLVSDQFWGHLMDCPMAAAYKEKCKLKSKQAQLAVQSFVEAFEAGSRDAVQSFVKEFEAGKHDAVPRKRGEAAVAEPPPTTNNYPHVADVVASDILSRGMPHKIADDVMARKNAGLKKYGTALQPMNGRDNLMDLYQELVDGVKYAKTEELQRAILHQPESKELSRIYEALLDILVMVYNLRNAYGDTNQEGNKAEPEGQAPQP